MFMVNHNLMYYHKYSLTEIEGMIPWERDAYLDMLANTIKLENEVIAAREAARH